MDAIAGIAAPAAAGLDPATVAPLRRLWREDISRHRGRLVTILLLTLAAAGLTALYPLVISRALDMFASHDRRILYQVPVLVVVITAGKAAAQYGQTTSVQVLVLQVIRGLQERMFGHLLAADVARIEREAPAQLAARFTTDATVIRDALIRTVNSLADAVTVVGLVASMLWMDWELSLIAGLLYPFAALPVQRVGRRVRRASSGMQERMGETATLLNESFAQVRVVRAYGLEAMEKGRADAAFQSLFSALVRMTRGRARVEPILEVLGGFAVAAVLGFAGWRAARGGATLGDFSGFVAALLIAARPLRALGSLNAALQEGLAGLTRVFAVIDEPPGIGERDGAQALPPGAGHLRFEDVGFRYPDGRPGLVRLSFEAKPGQTVALVGPSGGGKSTALSLIPRLHDPDPGRITLDGADLREVSLRSLREAIAYVGQDTMLFDTSVAANIRMGRPGASDALVRDAATAAAAADFIEALPDGFETRVGPGGQRLSGGQRQRIALARALARNPRVLLLDEATNALDAANEAAVQDAIARLRQGRTTIIVAHRLATVRSADLVVVMQDGAAIESGSHETLMEQDGLYARLVRTQALAA